MAIRKKMLFAVFLSIFFVISSVHCSDDSLGTHIQLISFSFFDVNLYICLIILVEQVLEQRVGQHATLKVSGKGSLARTSASIISPMQQGVTPCLKVDVVAKGRKGCVIFSNICRETCLVKKAKYMYLLKINNFTTFLMGVRVSI